MKNSVKFNIMINSVPTAYMSHNILVTQQGYYRNSMSLDHKLKEDSVKQVIICILQIGILSCPCCQKKKKKIQKAWTYFLYNLYISALVISDD